MACEHIGFMHPGLMGISLAAAAQECGHKAYWLSTGRSRSSRERTEKYGLLEVGEIAELVEKCSIIISVCPPHAAVEVARQVQAVSFDGIYADVNAVSPQRVVQIGELMSEKGIEIVDGGIIGPPAWKPGTTWLYLSGKQADRVARCFNGSSLGVEVIGEEIGKASALKMCFAAHTKGTTALLCAVVAAAEKMGVWRELEKQWSRKGSDFVRSTIERMQEASAKAWRFSGEMEEISSTFGQAGLPRGFHAAASEIYRRISTFKDAEKVPELPDILEALLEPRQPSP